MLQVAGPEVPEYRLAPPNGWITDPLGDEIGQQLNMSARTIEGHRLEIYAELGISSRSELVAWAVAHDLFTAPVGYYAEAKES